MLPAHLQLLAFTLALAPGPFLSLALADMFSNAVHTVTATEFDGAIVNTGNATSVIAFVSSVCEHCQAMAPEYSTAAGYAAKLSPPVPFYAIYCDDTENNSFCIQDQSVTTTPTIKLFHKGNPTPIIYNENGARSAAGLITWVSSNIQ